MARSATSACGSARRPSGAARLRGVSSGLVPAKGSQVRSLLLLAMPGASPGNAERLIEDYQTRPGRHLYAYELDGAVAGVIGLAGSAPGEAEITHVAVEELMRRRGIGRAMIEAVIQRHALSRLEAETDWDAGYFYRACGFRVWSLGARGDDEGGGEAERLRCVWTRQG